MRIQRPRPVRGNIRRQVAIGERIVVRHWRVYQLPPTPNWVASDNRLNWLEKLIDGLAHRGWFKESDIYLRVDPAAVTIGQPLAYIIPPRRGDSAWIVLGEKAEDLLEDARILPRFNEGALFVKTSP